VPERVAATVLEGKYIVSITGSSAGRKLSLIMTLAGWWTMGEHVDSDQSK